MDNAIQCDGCENIILKLAGQINETREPVWCQTLLIKALGTKGAIKKSTEFQTPSEIPGPPHPLCQLQTYSDFYSLFSNFRKKFKLPKNF